ncbi:hypothetical protein PIB30_016593 [Stylosanthes scabra]|uniref:Uncharacterized protein n=1 Tax=Stylosanthes scabra TaxID=79078 RepID=A0ABU6T9E3_9FABA|nr:hypothetical protein [Stylosanthes scabra]
MIATNPNYEWLSRKTLSHTLSRGRVGGINPVPKVLGNSLVRSCFSSYTSNWTLKRGRALARKLGIPILAFIKNLPNATVRPHGGERAGVQSMVDAEIDRLSCGREGEACRHTVWSGSTRLAPRVSCSRAIGLCGRTVPCFSLFGFPLFNPCFPCSS